MTSMILAVDAWNTYIERSIVTTSNKHRCPWHLWTFDKQKQWCWTPIWAQQVQHETAFSTVILCQFLGWAVISQSSSDTNIVCISLIAGLCTTSVNCYVRRLSSIAEHMLKLIEARTVSKGSNSFKGENWSFKTRPNFLSTPSPLDVLLNQASCHSRAPKDIAIDHYDDMLPR